MTVLKDKLDEMARIKAELQRMEDDDTVTEETEGDYRDTLIARWEQLDKESAPIIRQMEKIRGITRAASDPANREDGDGSRRSSGPEFMQRHDPFAELDRVGDGLVSRSEMVSRAMNAVEAGEKRGLLTHEWAENAAERASNPRIAQHMLLTGSDAYREAFDEYLRTGNPMGFIARGLNTGTGTTGVGYMLPLYLDPSIILTNASSANPYRRICRVVQTTSNTWNGVNSAGVNAAWLAEGTAASDNSPTINQIQITPAKAAAWVFGSYEALDDSEIGRQLPTLLADARDRLEEAAFTSGTGVAPNGLLTALGTGTGTNVSVITSGAQFVAADVYALNGAVSPRFRLTNNAAWLSNIFHINRVRSLDVYGGGSFWANIGADVPERLLGKPIYESTTMTAATAAGSQVMVFGDFNQAIIADRVGVSMLYEPMVKAAGTANLPTGQAGWFMFWRVGFGLSTTGAFKVLKAT